jgi:hypothetical protein
MILLGSRVFSTKTVIAARRKGWVDGLEATADDLLSAGPLSDQKLRDGLVNRWSLKLIEVDTETWPDEGFQLVAQYDGMEPCYSFSRQVFYTGDAVLWKQMPYNGCNLDVRMKIDVMGNAFLTGYCTKAERERVDPMLRTVVTSLPHHIERMRFPLIEYNLMLKGVAAAYIEDKPKTLERLRAGLY